MKKTWRKPRLKLREPARQKGKEKRCGGWNWRVKRSIEAKGLFSEVKVVSVNLEGESRHRHARANMARKERENQTIMENKVNGKAPWDEGAEVHSPKRKVIRVESEATQDFLRESVDLSPEEAEEISFVPQRPTEASVSV